MHAVSDDGVPKSHLAAFCSAKRYYARSNNRIGALGACRRVDDVGLQLKLSYLKGAFILSYLKGAFMPLPYCIPVVCMV